MGIVVEKRFTQQRLSLTKIALVTNVEWGHHDTYFEFMNLAHSVYHAENINLD